MSHVPTNNIADIRQTVIKDGIVFGNREGAPDYSETDNNAFFAVLGGSGENEVYITRGKEGDIVKWSLRDIYNLSVLVPKGFSTRESESPPVYGSVGADVLLSAFGHLILANTKETSMSLDNSNPVTTVEYHPYRVRWSSFLNPEEFTISTTTNASYIDLQEDESNGPILTLLPLQDVIVAYKGSSIYNLNPTDDSIELFSADMISPDRGIIGPKAVTPVLDGASHLIIAPDNFYVYDGVELRKPTLPVGTPIRDYFYTKLDYSKKDSVFAQSVPARSECWIFFETIEHRREALCWNWERQSWTHHRLPMRSMNVITSLGAQDLILGGVMNPDVLATGGDERGIASLFGEQNSDYIRDRMNREVSLLQLPITGEVDLPAIPYVERGKKGERMRRHSFRSVEIEMDVGFSDDVNEDDNTELQNMKDNPTVEVRVRSSDNLTLEPSAGDPMSFNLEKPLEANRYNFTATEADQQKREYVGLRIKFSSPDYLEELGQVIENEIEFEPY